MREEAGRSQVDLARLADLNPSFIARMERGRQNPGDVVDAPREAVGFDDVDRRQRAARSLR